MPRVAIMDCDGEPNPDGSGDDRGLMGTNIVDWLREPEDESAGTTWVHLRWKTHPEELQASAAEEFTAFSMPGSRSMVIEREDWITPVAELVREAHGLGKPLVGICFGHQFVADSLGGKVGWREGEEFNCAVDEIELTAAAAAAGFGNAPLRLMKGHIQQLTELPPGATLLGSSASTLLEIFTVGDNVLCCQGHPDPDFTHELVSELMSVSELMIPGVVKDGSELQ